MEPHSYRVHITGTGPKTGTLGSEDGLPELPVGSPPQFGGAPGLWSPEHLLVAAVSSCLMTTFKAIAELSGLAVLDYTDSASGLLVQDEDGLYRISEITLRPRVTIADETKLDRALRLIDKAERVCLIGRSINSTVHLEPKVAIAVPV
jgi:organic hydroperoxide reductase OsmC/OhrA